MARYCSEGAEKEKIKEGIVASRQTEESGIFRLQGGQALLQCLFLLPARGHVTDESRDPQRFSRFITQQDNREFQRNACPIFPYRRYGQQLLPIAGDAGAHDFMVTLPVPSAQALWDNEIQALPHGLLSLVAKHGFGPCIPETNLTVPVGKDDRLLGAFHNLLTEPLMRIRRHMHSLHATKINPRRRPASCRSAACRVPPPRNAGPRRRCQTAHIRRWLDRTASRRPAS